MKNHSHPFDLADISWKRNLILTLASAGFGLTLLAVTHYRAKLHTMVIPAPMEKEEVKKQADSATGAIKSPAQVGILRVSNGLANK